MSATAVLCQLLSSWAEAVFVRVGMEPSGRAFQFTETTALASGSLQPRCPIVVRGSPCSRVSLPGQDARSGWQKVCASGLN